MRPGTDKLLAKAARALAAAEVAWETGAPDLAAARAFAAVLAAAKARLNERGVRLIAHVRVAAAYATLPALDGAPPGVLSDAIALRRRLATEADLWAPDDTGKFLDAAREFVAAIDQHLGAACR